jgi:hypothetical protein
MFEDHHKEHLSFLINTDHDGNMSSSIQNNYSLPVSDLVQVVRLGVGAQANYFYLLRLGDKNNS